MATATVKIKNSTTTAQALKLFEANGNLQISGDYADLEKRTKEGNVNITHVEAMDSTGTEMDVTALGLKRDKGLIEMLVPPSTDVTVRVNYE